MAGKSGWSVVLASNEDLRGDRGSGAMWPLTLAQCRLRIEALQAGMHRSSFFAPARRTVVSLAQADLQWLPGAALNEGLNLSVRPSSKGSGPALLLALLEVQRQELDATLAIFPPIRYVADELRLLGYVRHAAARLDSADRSIVLLAVEPRFPDLTCSWLLSRPSSGGAHDPRPGMLVFPQTQIETDVLFECGAWWASNIAVFRADALLELVEQLYPGAWGALLEAATHGWDAVEGVYRSLQCFDLYRDLFSVAPHRVQVLEARSVIADPSPPRVDEGLEPDLGPDSCRRVWGLDY